MNKLTVFKNKIKNKYSRLKTKLFSAVVALMTMVSAYVPANAVTVNTGLNTEQLLGGIVDFICKLALYIGIVIVATGVFMLIMAYKDDNSEQQTRGVRVAVVGAALVGFQALLRLTGLIS